MFKKFSNMININIYIIFPDFVVEMSQSNSKKNQPGTVDGGKNEREREINFKLNKFPM